MAIYIHESPNSILNIKDSFKDFGGALFALPADSESAGYYEHKHFFEIDDDSIAETSNLRDYDFFKDFISKEVECEDDEELIDVLYDVVVKEDYSNAAQAENVLGSIEFGDFYARQQSLRFNFAVKNGFAAVGTHDEFDGKTIMLNINDARVKRIHNEIMH